MRPIVFGTPRAVVGTIRLLLDLQTLRALPWRYIRKLPFRDRWIGFATLTLTLSVINMVVGAAAPHQPSVVCANAALYIACAGIFSSLLRRGLQRRKVR